MRGIVVNLTNSPYTYDHSRELLTSVDSRRMDPLVALI